MNPTAVAILAATPLAAIGLLTGPGDTAAPDPYPAEALPSQDEIVRIPPSPQVLGDADAGRDFVYYGDYIGAGIPSSIWRLTAVLGERGQNLLGREGPSALLPHGVNLFTTPEGVEVVAGANCLECHASMFDGELVVGLGNSLADFTGSVPDTARLRTVADTFFPPDAPQRTALERYLRGIDALDGRIAAPFRGLNPAFRLEEVAASHRNPDNLTWSDDPVYEPIDEYTASDTPAWWHLKKKHALYHNAMGRGDFRRLLQQIMVVAVEDKDHAAQIFERMDDVLAFLYSIEPPEYPGEIDTDLAALGRTVFEQNCASCHGTYGEPWVDADPTKQPEWTYPNKLVPASVVGTDPFYAEDLRRSGLWRWYNESWFVTGAEGAESYTEPPIGYIAPPLDGVWITAPYFHNGSVPDLFSLLDSSQRPDVWKRSFRDDDYDLDRVGWRFTPLDAPDGDLKTYDTTLRGYSNQGHTYGDELTEDERRTLLEYLKSL